ncbi:MULTISPECIES: methionyl-tRNA formyltransferase [unclassified Enterococcus]|uniref:methionyl-tRNA formyltransferase n=1 Tax=unclassified Enterococcus TaxID=2608891 RepID=UPI001551A87A|nr:MULTISPECIES: methionyl-tRNA formyltransferase [unclassified Enterococcus]MBS7576858.1 methionyl-tRNA formyltransferase [Enterococcus sp. MMGLQ5-2]MBS7584265.1 methionyl-tRNA formyltransferase [Enterococcus sp. MMGLQ5-1]NPD12121.1 methionyl-tRNA formyltransferase [Enterococcus sp. MMGLQ5-1]NPD36693.1 methionyl-tRNA formyltransferase [Enterococcus sp. MMGLQ5-2]
MTRIVFMGTPAFSVPILEGLVANHYQVIAVVTQPDRRVGRKKVIQAPPVKVAAVKLGIPVLQPEKIKDSLEMAEIIALKPDLIVTAAFGQFLPEALLQAASIGAINVHASLLPKYRGGAPVHHAIMNGDDKTGVTIIEMVKKMDAGTMWAQREIPIEWDDNVGTMFDKLSILGKTLLLETLPSYIAGELKGEAQVEALVSITPNITAEQERIDWQQGAAAIYNQVRGLYPWPVAHTTWQNERLKIQKVAVIDQQTDSLPGTIVKKGKKELLVATNHGLISIKELQPFGKAPMSIESFLNGLGQKLKVGEQFGE